MEYKINSEFLARLIATDALLFKELNALECGHGKSEMAGVYVRASYDINTGITKAVIELIGATPIEDFALEIIYAELCERTNVISEGENLSIEERAKRIVDHLEKLGASGTDKVIEDDCHGT